jgi:hypothetical protein
MSDSEESSSIVTSTSDDVVDNNELSITTTITTTHTTPHQKQTRPKLAKARATHLEPKTFTPSNTNAASTAKQTITQKEQTAQQNKKQEAQHRRVRPLAEISTSEANIITRNTHRGTERSVKQQRRVQRSDTLSSLSSSASSAKKKKPTEREEQGLVFVPLSSGVSDKRGGSDEDIHHYTTSVTQLYSSLPSAFWSI